MLERDAGVVLIRNLDAGDSGVDGEHAPARSCYVSCCASISWFASQVVRRFQVRESRAFAFWLVVLVVTGSGVNIYLRTVIQLMPDFQYFVFQRCVCAAYRLMSFMSHKEPCRTRLNGMTSLQSC